MTKDEQIIEDKRQLLISAYTDAIERCMNEEHKAALAWSKLFTYNKTHPHKTKLF
jgi:hypothetical protein